MNMKSFQCLPHPSFVIGIQTGVQSAWLQSLPQVCFAHSTLAAEQVSHIKLFPTTKCSFQQLYDHPQAAWKIAGFGGTPRQLRGDEIGPLSIIIVTLGTARWPTA